MRHTRPSNRADRLQLHVAVIDIVEEARATTEENRNDVNLQFVDEAGGEILLRECWLRRRAPHPCHSLPASPA